MSKIFLQRGSSFSLAEDNFTVHPKLEKGLYDLRFSMETGISLEKIGESFQFDYKLYNLDNKFIDHVVNSYKNAPTKKNMGILLNGERGTGKTVCAKYLANLLDLPIIAISGECPGLANFIMSIKQDVIFFFDEFEKNFRRGTNEYNEDQSGESLLSIMDGVYNTGFAHIFILTTNELRINKNFLSRPSRIKYLKTFDSIMSKEVLEEIADDFLNDASKKEELIAFVSTLEFASIDIVKSIIEEMNIHNCGIDEFKRFFNVSISEYTYCYYSTYIYERDGDNYSMEEFFADVKEPYNDENKRVMYYNSFRCDRPFESLTVGSEFRNDEIVYLDPEKKYIVTYDIVSSRKTFYKVISVYQNKLYK